MGVEADLASRKIKWERSKKEKEEKKRLSVVQAEEELKQKAADDHKKELKRVQQQRDREVQCKGLVHTCDWCMRLVIERLNCNEHAISECWQSAAQRSCTCSGPLV